MTKQSTLIPGDAAEGRAQRMKGVLFGHAVGDALGLGARFLTRDEFHRQYPEGLKTYGEIAALDHLRAWRRGDWTDATGQMLCVFDTLYHRGRAEPAILARLLHERRATEGFAVLNPVLDHPLFLLSPLEAAELAELPTGDPLTDNSALKRSTIIGIWDSDDLDLVKRNAEAACLVTHPRPESVSGCIAVACAVAELVQGKPVCEALQTADRASGGVFAPFFASVIDEPLSSYRLDEPGRAEVPEKTLYAAFHVLKHATSFIAGLQAVISEGGDAAANGAVAGALLGARFGFQDIPENLVRGLLRGSELEDRLQEKVAGLSAGTAEPSLEVGERFHRAAAYRYQRWKIRIKAWGAALVWVLNWVAHLPVVFLRYAVRWLIWLLSFLTGWITEDVFSVEDAEGRKQVIGFAQGATRDRAILALGIALVLIYGFSLIGDSLLTPLRQIPFNPIPEIMRVLHRTMDPPSGTMPQASGTLPSALLLPSSTAGATGGSTGTTVSVASRASTASAVSTISTVSTVSAMIATAGGEAAFSGHSARNQATSPSQVASGAIATGTGHPSGHTLCPHCKRPLAAR